MVARTDAHVDGDSPFVARLQNHVHLAICRDCRAHVDQVRQTKRLVAAAARRVPADEAMIVSLVRDSGWQDRQLGRSASSNRPKGDLP
jgi:anti-sigma factor RsiW